MGTADAVRGPAASGWHLGYYTPSAHGTLSNAMTTSGGGIATFNFTDTADTALLVTDQGSQKGALLGNLTSKTVTATFAVTGATAFEFYGEGTPSNPCSTPTSARLFFQTSNAGGFDATHYWWSNGTDYSRVLASGEFTISVAINALNWSDWNGQIGTAVPEPFAQAASNVTEIGISFGGGCFFENGVGTTDGSGVFTLRSFTVN